MTLMPYHKSLMSHSKIVPWRTFSLHFGKHSNAPTLLIAVVPSILNENAKER